MKRDSSGRVLNVNGSNVIVLDHLAQMLNFTYKYLQFVTLLIDAWQLTCYFICARFEFYEESDLPAYYEDQGPTKPGVTKFFLNMAI